MCLSHWVGTRAEYYVRMTLRDQVRREYCQVYLGVNMFPVTQSFCVRDVISLIVAAAAFIRAFIFVVKPRIKSARKAVVKGKSLMCQRVLS